MLVLRCSSISAAGRRAGFGRPLCLIDGDLLTCANEQIRDTKVVKTWLDGERLLSADR